MGGSKKNQNMLIHTYMISLPIKMYQISSFRNYLTVETSYLERGFKEKAGESRN